MAADLKCSYCGSLNGGHTMACSALAQSADEGDPDIKRYGWSREQVPLTAEERARVDAHRASKPSPAA